MVDFHRMYWIVFQIKGLVEQIIERFVEKHRQLMDDAFGRLQRMGKMSTCSLDVGLENRQGRP